MDSQIPKRHCLLVVGSLCLSFVLVAVVVGGLDVVFRGPGKRTPEFILAPFWPPWRRDKDKTTKTKRKRKQHPISQDDLAKRLIKSGKWAVVL